MLVVRSEALATSKVRSTRGKQYRSTMSHKSQQMDQNNSPGLYCEDLIPVESESIQSQSLVSVALSEAQGELV